MIQRKQTLFLLLITLAGLLLLFVPSGTATVNGKSTDILLTPVISTEFSATSWHMLAIGLNFSAIVLGFVTIFLYQKRELQIKLCYVLMLIELGLTLIISMCPLVVKTDAVAASGSGVAILISATGMVAAYLAARLIKKDIELLKSADRIR